MGPWSDYGECREQMLEDLNKPEGLKSICTEEELDALTKRAKPSVKVRISREPDESRVR